MEQKVFLFPENSNFVIRFLHSTLINFIINKN